jgi:hypothetical protein
MDFNWRRDDPAPLIAGLWCATLIPGVIGFYSTTLAAVIVVTSATLAAGAITRDRSKLFAAAMLVPAVAAFTGSVYGGRYERRRAAEEQERSQARALETAQNDLRRAAALRADRERAAAEQQRRAAAILEEARRTPRERAALIVNLLSGVGDAGSSGPFAALCAARQQAARIGAEGRRDSYTREALRSLAAFERDELAAFRERVRGYRMVMCCDGTASPTCECSRRSHRGCCSHHGGMCGCEPLPTEIACSP